MVNHDRTASYKASLRKCKLRNANNASIFSTDGSLGKSRGRTVKSAAALGEVLRGCRKAFIICGFRGDPRYPRYRGVGAIVVVR